MKLSEARNAYYNSSDTASKIGRQAAYAGIAAIWIFKGVNDGIYVLADNLYVPLFLFILALTLDLAHYLYKSLVWGWYSYHHHQRHGPEKDPDHIEVVPQEYINWLSLVFFWGKSLTLATGYIFLLSYLWTIVSFE